MECPELSFIMSKKHDWSDELGDKVHNIQLVGGHQPDDILESPTDKSDSAVLRLVRVVADI